MTIKLNFIPKGSGPLTEYYHSEKPNACVCCQDDVLENLTKHHIVPVEYRKHMPESIKSRSSHDIVVMCQTCHAEYEEQYAQLLKKQLEEECFIERPKLTEDRIKTLKAYHISKLLMDKERCKKIPKGRLYELYETVRTIFGHTRIEEISEMKIDRAIEKQDLEIGKEVLELQLSNEEFIIMWRTHFIESMNPQFMPKGWSINTQIED